jgi:hypothetical protein
MSEEGKVVEEQPVEEQAKAGQAGAGKGTVTEEIKVQAQDLFKAINDVVRESTVRRVTILRGDRVLVDIPLVAGVAVSAVMAFYLPIISALAAVGLLLSGCTLRIEREEPPAKS